MIRQFGPIFHKSRSANASRRTADAAGPRRRGDRMKRRDFITLVGGAAAWPFAARAQQPTTKLPRIGWLVTGSPTTYRFSVAAFLDGLKALGYVDGRNCRIEYRWAEGNIARLADLANELVRENVDVILAGGWVGAQAAKRATSVIPIVTAGVGDLVEAGLVRSLAHPGGNLDWISGDEREPRGTARTESGGRRAAYAVNQPAGESGDLRPAHSNVSTNR